MKTRSEVNDPKLIKSKSQDSKVVKKSNSKDETAQKAKLNRNKKVAASQKQELKSDLQLKPLKRKDSKKKEEVKQKPIEEEKAVCTRSIALGGCFYGKPKPFTKHTTKIAKLTQWIEITIDELHKILKEERKHHKDVEEEEICPICRCELYDDILKMSDAEINKKQTDQLDEKEEIEVVKFKDCLDHFYHKSCTEGMLGGKEYIRCAVCSKVYGEMIGDSPPGEMKWKHYPKGKLPLETYEKSGTYEIHYLFIDGVRNGVPYRGTRRVAYLPDTYEGKEVLALLIKSFQRKLTFTVGDSVTTGRKNVVVWNSIHHKTSTHGGTLSYGYPDPTYFNRVKMELADKGVLLEKDDVGNLVKKSGKVIIQ